MTPAVIHASLHLYTLYSEAVREAGAFCIFFLGRLKKKPKCASFWCLCAELLRVCVCLLSVWERVYSQVLADILGLCGCGWWLACCADNREGTASFFSVFLSACVLSACVCACVCEYIT